MAEYYPLIARAIEGLSDKSPPMRRAVYERARTALQEQLRSLDPPLAEVDIRRERLALDDAIEQVEAEYDPDAHRPNLPASVGLPGAPAEAPAAALPPAPPPRKEESFQEEVFEEEPFREEPFREEPFREEPYQEEPAGERLPVEAEEHRPVHGEAIPARPRVDSYSPVLHSTGRGRAVVLGVVLAVAIAAIAVAAWLLRDTPDTLATQPQVAETPAAPAPEPGNGKIAERVGGGPALPAQPGDPGSRQEVGVAQRAIYYEEDTTNPQRPREVTGRAVWRLEGVNAGQGQPLETAVRAVVDYPEVGMTMNILLRRNLDPTLPASHTIELSFNTTPGDAGRVVRDVGLLQFKNDMRARGTPIAGLPVPVRENLFLIGLSNLATDVERNIELLMNRNWIDLPIRMVSGQRAIISFEKGVAGEQVMSDAFRQWQ
jgi:hypothetical protein